MKSFNIFSELESHLDIEDHPVKEERKGTLCDNLRREWVDMFTTADNITEDAPCAPGKQQNVSGSTPSDEAAAMGWALPKPRAGSSRFTDKVKRYLTSKFDLGEQTGNKVDPQQVSYDMRKARDEQTNQLFSIEEWLTKRPRSI